MKYEKSCGTIIIDMGRVLLVKHNAGHWGFPKGHTNFGESEIETAIRETKEETNLDVKVDENKRYTVNYMINDSTQKEVVFFVASLETNKIVKEEKEISDIKFVSFKQALSLLTHNDIKTLLKKY